LFDSFVPNEKNLEQIGLNHLQAALGAFIQVDKQALQDLSELEQLQILFEQARDAYLIPQDIEFSQVRQCYLLAQANIHMAQALPILWPVKVPCVHVEAAESLSGLSSVDGWDELLSEVTFVRVAGNHESILHAEHVKEVAK